MNVIKAAIEGDLPKIQKILSNEVDPEVLIYAVTWAARNGHLEIVKYLVASGANIHATNDLGLKWACRPEDRSYLLKQGADILDDDEAPLTQACIKNQFEVAKYLISIGNYDLAECLLLACEHGHLEIVKYIVERGVDVNAYVQDMTILTMPCEKGHLEVVKYLVESGADIHADYDIAIQVASQCGHLEVVKYLVSRGANIHEERELALRWACVENHFEVVQYLVELGADIHVWGDMPLRCANHIDIVRFLVSKGGDRKVIKPAHKKILAQETIRKCWRRYRIRKWARDLISKKSLG